MFEYQCGEMISIEDCIAVYELSQKIPRSQVGMPFVDLNLGLALIQVSITLAYLIERRQRSL